MHKKLLITLVAVCLAIDVLDFLLYKLRGSDIAKALAATVIKPTTAYDDQALVEAGVSESLGRALPAGVPEIRQLTTAHGSEKVDVVVIILVASEDGKENSTFWRNKRNRK